MDMRALWAQKLNFLSSFWPLVYSLREGAKQVRKLNSMNDLNKREANQQVECSKPRTPQLGQSKII